MPFLRSDLYLTSGTSELINNWVDPVYKFDSSSFYNWEQDNLPIYDLEDRDDYLHEMAGYPASSITGMMLTVSDAGVDNKKVFGSLSAAVDALPNTIRFPIIIEVAASGQLGELRLENLQFDGSGAGLEIVNRGFAKIMCGSTTPYSYVQGIDSGASGIVKFHSPDLSATMKDSSCLGVSSTVYRNGNPFDYWDNFTRAFLITPEWSIDSAGYQRTITMSSYFKDSGVGFFSTTASSFNSGIYVDNSVSSDLQITNDAMSPAQLVQRAPMATPTSNDRVTGFYYANNLSKVLIKDCTGNIYLRGFCVDGTNGYELSTTGGIQITDVGFDIQNSEAVIENCTASRCKNAGIKINNSNIILNRGFIAFRNYELRDGGSSHLAEKWENGSAGLKANNSNITLSASISAYKGCPIDSPFCFYRNLVGMDIQNSQITTPMKAKLGRNMAGNPSTENRGSETIVLQVFFNKDIGILAKNSVIRTNERVSVFQNDQGMELDNSLFETSQSTFDHNKRSGVRARNSVFVYNRTLQKTNYGDGGPFGPPNEFTNNGQHVLLQDSSQFVPMYTSAMDTIFEPLVFSANHELLVRDDATGGGGITQVTKPAVVLEGGSFMEAVASRSILNSAQADSAAYQSENAAIKGAAFRVVDQSTLKLAGTKDVATFIRGPYNPDKQQYIAGVYTGDSSKVSFHGPTTIAQFGVDVLAEDHSTMEFSPYMKDGSVDASSFSLFNTDNHTKVQLHATRACLVANRNSNIHMRDLGDFHEWPEPYRKESVLSPDYNTANAGHKLNTSAFCSSGFMQFYPNPFAPYVAAADGTTALDLPALAHPASLDDMPGAFQKLTAWTAGGVAAASVGGMCVRAVGNSNVKVQNVNFPCGWANTSGAYYDVSAGVCAHLRIWNIADSSKLHASYLSLGGNYPRELSGSYYGPDAVWVSGGWGGAASAVLSGAPSSTPDTSSLSILDSFGRGAQIHGGFYGKDTWENIGPFRLYVSPHPIAKFLGYPINGAGWGFNPGYGSTPRTPVSMGYEFGGGGTTLVKNVPYQLFAQGYAASSDCSATPTYILSSIYNELAFSAYQDNKLSMLNARPTANYASSYFYTSAMLSPDIQNNIWFDESAMNTFANAKNGTLSTSGRQKIVSYYKAIKEYPGESFWASTGGGGLGLGSVNLFDLDRDL